MSHKSNLLLPISAILASSAFMLTSCSDDEVQEINQGREIAFTTQISRATPTTASEFDAFKVWAHGVGFANMVINGDEAKKSLTEANIYNLTKNYYWPNDVEKITFWAYGPTSGSNAITITESFTSTSQVLGPYTVTADETYGGRNHKDLVVASTTATRLDGTTVGLKFKHAFSQIEVKAVAGKGITNDNKIIKIAGAWIVNASSTGTMSFTTDNKISWGSLSTPAKYGVTYTGDNIPQLSNSPTCLIGESSTTNTSLMLIPQTVDAVTFNGAAHNGAYILLSCRIEVWHDGITHPDNDDAILSEGNKHYHQLFPVSKTFERNQYGETCVPIKINWEAGKKYIYTLELCGSDSGAGVYPPGNPNAGTPVLDDPIKFSVSVDEWTSDSNPAQEVTPTIP